MWPFKCRVCAEKDNRIADLKDQLNKQMSLTSAIVIPQSPQYVNAVTVEANRALEGLGTPTVDLQETPDIIGAVERQAMDMLTGRYS